MWISKELLARHFEYSLWASLKVLEAAEKLPFDAIEQDRGNSFGGILATLTHIFLADRVWFKRFSGDPYFAFTQPGDSFDLAKLKTEWPIVMNEFTAWIRAQEDSKFQEKLFWRNIKGEDKEELMYKILLHIVNHGTYHRGQVITMIKQAGGEVVSTDLVYFPGM
ncbi:MAG: hypothetical protein NTW74_14505 [Acidobacteria bacterium]|nr:hypothetical protein [Acidobacteriota bacterium]